MLIPLICTHLIVTISFNVPQFPHLPKVMDLFMAGVKGAL